MISANEGPLFAEVPLSEDGDPNTDRSHSPVNHRLPPSHPLLEEAPSHSMQLPASLQACDEKPCPASSRHSTEPVAPDNGANTHTKLVMVGPTRALMSTPGNRSSGHCPQHFSSQRQLSRRSRLRYPWCTLPMSLLHSRSLPLKWVAQVCDSNEVSAC